MFTSKNIWNLNLAGAACNYVNAHTQGINLSFYEVYRQSCPDIPRGEIISPWLKRVGPRTAELIRSHPFKAVKIILVATCASSQVLHAPGTWLYQNRFHVNFSLLSRKKKKEKRGKISLIRCRYLPYFTVRFRRFSQFRCRTLLRFLSPKLKRSVSALSIGRLSSKFRRERSKFRTYSHRKKSKVVYFTLFSHHFIWNFVYSSNLILV